MKDLLDLLNQAKKPKNWIVKDLILKGDQVMIAAAPKTGKSLLASQLAISVVTGGEFLGWEVEHPAKVIYFNLEINEDMFSERLGKQIIATQSAPQRGMLTVQSQVKSFNILNPQSRTEIATMIRNANADLVIFDVLSRCHCSGENNNSEMKEVLKELRLVCGNAASVVIHHSRKPPQGMEETNLGAYALRGASAVHGEVDLVLSLAKRSGQGARYSVKFSARNIREPDEMFLSMDTDTLCFNRSTETEEDRLAEVLTEAFSMSRRGRVNAIQQHVMDTFEVSKRQAQRLLGIAISKGYISEPQRSGSEYWYEVLDTTAITCFGVAA